MMEQHLERSKAHLATMQKHLDALKTFYAVLNHWQQKTLIACINACIIAQNDAPDAWHGADASSANGGGL